MFLSCPKHVRGNDSLFNLLNAPTSSPSTSIKDVFVGDLDATKQPFCREVSFKVEIHFCQTKHILPLTGLSNYSEMTQVICTFELEHELPFPTFRWFQPSHPNHQPPCHPSIHSRSRRLPSRGEKPGASRSPRRVGAATECLRRSDESWETVGGPFGEVVGGPGTRSFPILGRFCFFFRGKSLWGGWMSKVFFGGLVG